MTAELIVCTMCGHRFDPDAHAICSACPLQKGCQLTCCPVCGFQTVDPSRSTLAKLASRFFLIDHASKSAKSNEGEENE